MPAAPQNQIHQGDNLAILRSIPTASIPLIYIDPPFNTQRTQRRDRISVTRNVEGTRAGFGTARYNVTRTPSPTYADTFDDFTAFIRPRLEEAHRLLTPTGSLFFHIDYRESHYAKVLLDTIFGRQSFINEIIWAYDYGGKPGAPYLDFEMWAIAREREPFPKTRHGMDLSIPCLSTTLPKAGAEAQPERLNCFPPRRH